MKTKEREELQAALKLVQEASIDSKLRVSKSNTCLPTSLFHNELMHISAKSADPPTAAEALEAAIYLDNQRTSKESRTIRAYFDGIEREGR